MLDLRYFPNLASEGYSEVSPQTDKYNCIAWAAGDDKLWWWPRSFKGAVKDYWPDEVPEDETVEAFVAAFQSIHYELCDNADFEAGFVKVALYLDENNIPTHAARQIRHGVWTSKIGDNHDIEHATLSGIEGESYGRAKIYLRRSA